MKGTGSKNRLGLCFCLILTESFLGGFIGMLGRRSTRLLAGWPTDSPSDWMSPIILNLGLLVVTFGLTIKITIASIIGVILSIIIYRFL